MSAPQPQQDKKPEQNQQGQTQKPVNPNDPQNRANDPKYRRQDEAGDKQHQDQKQPQTPNR